MDTPHDIYSPIDTRKYQSKQGEAAAHKCIYIFSLPIAHNTKPPNSATEREEKTLRRRTKSNPFLTFTPPLNHPLHPLSLSLSQSSLSLSLPCINISILCTKKALTEQSVFLKKQSKFLKKASSFPFLVQNFDNLENEV